MRIDKSPFHPNFSSLVNNKNLIKNSNLEKSTEENTLNSVSNVENKKNTFSFLRWIKGLVNPLQNLPIISGIYSSLNSENKESDRDLVQNSLGGFLYGGPIGAIAGFGNWVFRKIFDKTPSELVLSFTGINKIWEKEKPITGQIAKNKKENIENKLDIESIDLELIKANDKKRIISNNSFNNNIENTSSNKTKNNKFEEIGKIEFGYPKWIPPENNEKKYYKKSLNLSMINNTYKSVNSVHTKKSVVEIIA